MQSQAYFLLLVVALVGFAAASPLVGDEDALLHRVRRNRPCTFGCSTTVVGNGLNVQGNPNGDRHRVITNQGSWGSSSGYQPARRAAGSGQGGSQRPAAGNGSPAGGNHGQHGGQGQPNDVQISRPCRGCTLDVQGAGNVIRS